MSNPKDQAGNAKNFSEKSLLLIGSIHLIIALITDLGHDRLNEIHDCLIFIFSWIIVIPFIGNQSNPRREVLWL